MVISILLKIRVSAQDKLMQTLLIVVLGHESWGAVEAAMK